MCADDKKRDLVAARPAGRPSLLGPTALYAAVPNRPQFNGATPLEWSRRMADSEMARKGGTMFAGGAPRARWDYTTSLFGLSLVKLSERTGDAKFAAYGAKTVESFIAADGTIATYKREEFNIDMIPPGKVLLARWEQGHRDARLRTPLRRCAARCATTRARARAAIWHKLRYPHQMWLDGLFMASPFLAHYAKVFEEPALFDDVANQILLMDRRAYDPKTGSALPRVGREAGADLGGQANRPARRILGRAQGWYAMALVDSLDFFSPTHPEVERINEVLRRVADGIVRWQDPQTGLWWQVMDQGGREGNYHEATASSMFVYALAKGHQPRLPAARKISADRPERLRGPHPRLHPTRGRHRPHQLTRCCEVAGLGYTNAKGRARDGSYEYYLSEPIIDNDLKGVGPFIFAGLEVQQLLDTKTTPLNARGWGDYDRVLARIKAPVFPARDFPITQFGAKPGADASAALKAAIAACSAAGGGRVVVPAGEWPTGAIHLLSNVNLHVSQGRDAPLKFPPSPPTTRSSSRAGKAWSA